MINHLGVTRRKQACHSKELFPHQFVPATYHLFEFPVYCEISPFSCFYLKNMTISEHVCVIVVLLF